MIFREVEQKIIKDINESGISIDAVYFIMKNIMREIEERYFEYCRMEDIEHMEATRKELENENIASANDNEGRTD